MGCTASSPSHSPQLRLDLGNNDAQPTSMKVVVIGAMSCGKTSLVVRLTQDSFADSMSSTIGAAFSTKSFPVSTAPAARSSSDVPLPPGGDTGAESTVQLMIWDTAGGEQFRALTRSFFRDARAGLVCFDMSSLPSFNQLGSWIKEFRDSNPRSDIWIIGCKSDLAAQRYVPKCSPHTAHGC